MFKTDLQRKIAIALGIIFLLTCILLVAFKVITIYILWTALLILPFIFVADICYLILPITIPVFLGLSTYTLIKKNYEKFNTLYEVLSVVIVTGIVNAEIDWTLSIRNYVMQTNSLRVYWLAYFAVALICGCMYIAKKKDTRLYLWVYSTMIIFYLLYKAIESIE